MANYTSTRADGADLDASLDLADSALQSGTSADNIDDSASTNKFTTDAEKLIFKAESASSFLSKHDGKFKGSGFVEWGKVAAGFEAVNQGLWTYQAVGSWENSFALGRSGSEVGTSSTKYPVVNLHLAMLSINLVNKSEEVNELNDINLPPAPDGLDKADGTGRHADLAAAIVAGGTGLTQSLIYAGDISIIRSTETHHNITQSGKAYPLGNKQYGSTTTGSGVNTNATETNPMWVNGIHSTDDTTVGNYWNWNAVTLTEAQKQAIVEDKENNIYSKNGELYQVTYEAYSHRINMANLIGTKERDIMLMIGAVWQEQTKRYLYVDSSVTYEVLGIALIQRRNQLAFDQRYNRAGAALYTDGKKGVETSISITSLADVANNTDYTTGNIASGSHGSLENYFDAIAASDIRDLRIDCSGRYDSRTGTEELRRRSISGEARGWEATQFLVDFTGSVPNYIEVPYYQSNGGSTTYLIGDPVRIAATFPDGVAGRWIPVIPDGTSKDFKFTKKLLSAVNRQLTTDDGTTWSSASFTPDSTNNDLTISFLAADVGLYNYTYNPNFTEEADNSVVLDGYISDVFASNNHEVVNGSTMCQSTIDKVSTANTSVKSKELIIQELMYFNDTKTLSTPVKHSVINLDADSSPALKCLFHAFDDNGVLVPHIKFKEMVYDVTWGDNNEFEITDSVATLTDNNGNTVLYGTHTLNDDWNILL